VPASIGRADFAQISRMLFETLSTDVANFLTLDLLRRGGRSQYFRACFKALQRHFGFWRHPMCMTGFSNS
jgi:hypothetical protein